MRRFTLLSVLAILLFAHAKGQTEVVQGVTQGKDFGVVYTLPKTEIIVSLNVTKVHTTPGEFARYAERYLRLSGVTMEKEEYWLLNSITAESIGTPDSEKSYFIKLRERTAAPLVELTKEGLLKSINVPFTNESEKAIVTHADPAAQKLNPKGLLTEEILTAGSTAKMAELTAREIYSIRESRNALVRGQADNMPKDGEQLKLMLNTLDEQEKALMQLFTGTKESTDEVVKITVIPGKEYKNEVVARFSTKLGVLKADNLAGEPVYLTLTNMNTVTIPEPDDKKKDVSGVAYNVPGRAKATLTFNNAKVFEGELPVTQYGIVEYLAASLFNKTSVIKVIFNPATGGLVKIDRE